MKENKTIEITKSEKIKRYNRIKFILGISKYVLGLLFLLILLVTGWNFDLRMWAVKTGDSPFVWILTYFFLAAALYELVMFPLTFLSGYITEKKFGLLNQSFGSWLGDLIKWQLVGLVFGLVAVQVLYLFIRKAGPWWWVPAGAVFAFFFILLAQLLPVAILPLFFKFRKLPEGELASRLTELCRRAGAGVKGIYEWKLSAKTNRANAALVGWGATRRVVLSDSLLSAFTPTEIEVVLAHELGHHHYGDIRNLLMIQIGLTFLAFWLAGGLFRIIGPYFDLKYLSDIAGLPLMGLIFLGLGFLSAPLVNWASRVMERRADGFALQMTEMAGSFISTIERLAALNMNEISPPRWVEILFHSHPSPARRIEAAKAFVSANRKNNHREE